MKYLLSSQLDVYRLDYLQRDSFFTGAGYGHFDWFRIIGTFELHGDADEDRTIVWPRKSAMAVEEYVFARYYMYQNVYLHKTTRGFEKLLVAMWQRARKLDPADALLLPSLADFWAADQPSVQQYLAIEEFTVLQQIQNWTAHHDNALSDLARRFLQRHRLVCIVPPDSVLKQEQAGYGVQRLDEWDRALRDNVAAAGFDPEAYCLKDEVKPKYHQPYFPEKEGDVQSAKNAIRIVPDTGSPPIEITQICHRLQPVTREQGVQLRHYVPEEVREEVKKLAAGFE
jgi:HD superfamily phosphohydrolase